MTQAGVDGQIAAELERLSAELAACKEDAERLKRAGYVLAMEVLQSNLVLDDEATAARDFFIDAAHSGKETP